MPALGSPFGHLIPRLRRPILQPLPHQGEPYELATGPFTGGARLQPLTQVNEGFTAPRLGPFSDPTPSPAPLPMPSPIPTPDPTPAPSPMPSMPARRPGLLGQIGSMDPLTLAMFMAPIAEILKHGSGSALYSAALQGKAQREDAEERRAEREQILKERADAKLTKDEEREARRREREEERADRDEERQYRREEAEHRRAQRLAPREETPSEKLAREKFEYEKDRDAKTTVSGDEKPADRMKRLRGEIVQRAKSGNPDPANRQRIKQIASILGVDPRVYLSELDLASRERGIRGQKSEADVARSRALTDKAKRAPAGRGRGRSASRSSSPLSKFYEDR